jgi:hypothetical protein
MFESIQPFAMTTANNTVTNVHNVPVKLMHNNDTEQVRFMLRKPAQLPDKYYYGNK